MAHEVRGVVATAKGAPVTIETVLVPDPGPGEALVRVQACGVCHTDLHYREGGINDDFPFLLGHEAAGVVEAVGPDVTSVAPGDFVVLNWRAVCGECRACRRGRPWYCFATHNATQKMTLADGTALAPALGIGAFAEKTLVAAGQCTKVDSRARPEAVGLLGCGVMAGLGAGHVHRRGQPRRHRGRLRLRRGGLRGHRRGPPGRGGQGHRRRPRSPASSSWPPQFGATDTVAAADVDPVEAIRALTGGFGADVCIEAVGNAKVMQQAFDARDLAGTLVQVGVPTPDMRIDMPMIEFFGHGGSLKPSWYGDCLPSRDFPMLVDLYLQGRLDLDRFVSETIALDGVEEAFHRMERGEVLRSVVVSIGSLTSGLRPSAPQRPRLRRGRPTQRRDDGQDRLCALPGPGRRVSRRPIPATGCRPSTPIPTARPCPPPTTSTSSPAPSWAACRVSSDCARYPGGGRPHPGRHRRQGRRRLASSTASWPTPTS